MQVPLQDAVRRGGVRYALSRVIPTLMTSTYTHAGHRFRARWIQWRGHVWLHRVVPA